MSTTLIGLQRAKVRKRQRDCDVSTIYVSPQIDVCNPTFENYASIPRIYRRST